MKEIKAKRDQMLILPPAIDDWVSKDHPIRFINEFVNSLDLAEMGIGYEREEGRPNYDPRMLLGIWLYGLMNKTRSSRMLEKMCYDSVALIWYTGMNYPDHNTLWRFFRNNKGGIKNTFKQTVQLAHKMDLIGLMLQALDGTKIEANASRDKTISKKKLDEVIKRIDVEIARILEEVESQRKGECESAIKLPEELTTKEKLREKILEKKRELEAEGLAYKNQTDPDSSYMKTTRGINLSYNNQIIVDEKNKIIVAAEATKNGNDNEQVTEMLKERQEIIEEKPKLTVADGGYFSGEQLKKAQEMKEEIIVNMGGGKWNNKREDGFDKQDFSYNETKDEYVCPYGGILEYERTYKKEDKKYELKVYKCRMYKDCKYASQCSLDKRGRTITQTPYDNIIEEHRQKQKIRKYEDALKKRKAVVEHIFGIIKSILGYTRTNFRGLDNVKSEWLMICSAYNLKKIIKIWRLKPEIVCMTR